MSSKDAGSNSVRAGMAVRPGSKSSHLLQPGGCNDSAAWSRSHLWFNTSAVASSALPVRDFVASEEFDAFQFYRIA